MDAVARRYGVLPFTDEFFKVWKSPYRQALLTSTLKIKTEEQLLLETMNKHFPNFMRVLLTNLLDGIGTTMVNLFSKKKINHLFKQTRSSGSSGFSSFEGGLTDMVKLPNGKIVRTR